MKLSEKIKELDFKGRDFPIIAGTVKFKLHNVHNGKDEVVEEHNMATNALKDVFTNNYGGLINYQNFADLYNTWLGGVLLFQNQLDLTSADDYGIPAYTSNPVKAHAGQIPLTDQADDLTRGNPDNTGTVLAVDSTKLRWEWGTSAGNGTIASLGLTHTDVGSYGCGSRADGRNPECLKSLNPFADIGSISRSHSYADNASAVLAIDGNIAYSFYLVNSTTVHIYRTPINNSKFKLQGGSLIPITDYTSMITVSIQDYNIGGKGDCYYHFDFDNQKLILFGVPTEGGSTLLKDEIDLSNWTDKTSTQSSITVTGAKLWKMMVWYYSSAQYGRLSQPLKAMVFDNHLFIYGYSSNRVVVDKIYKINLAQPDDISEVDVSNFSTFNSGENQKGSRTNTRFAVMGEIIAHNSFLINGDKTFQVVGSELYSGSNENYAIENAISSPQFGLSTSMNMVSVCKLYLATKFNLPNAVTKTSAQSMTVEYQLTEV